MPLHYGEHAHAIRVGVSVPHRMGYSGGGVGSTCGAHILLVAGDASSVGIA